MSFKLFTDSSANLTDEIIEKYDIEIVSLTYLLDGKEYLGYEKGKKTDLKPLYEELRLRKPASTSCINEDTFYKTFKPFVEKGEDILYVGFSSGLSNTYAMGEAALSKLKKEYPNANLLSVDTLAAAGGEGLLVLYAAEQRAAGKSIEEVRSWLEANKLKLAHWFTVDDLFYLYRGGRVNKTSFIIGSLAQIKPVLHVDNNGKLVGVAKVIGRKKALVQLVENIAKNIVNPEEQTLYISHGDCIDDVNFAISKLKEKIKFKDIVVNMLDPVIGVHSGPGTVAIFALANSRD